MRKKSVIFLFLLFLLVMSTLMCQSPDVVFNVKAKDIGNFVLFGENDEYALLRTEDQVWVYNTRSGDKLWEKDLKKKVFNNEQVINGTYSYSTKKNEMYAYDLMTGNLLWEKKLENKSKDLYYRRDFKDVFVLAYKKKWTGHRADTGDKIWEIDSPDCNGKYIDEDVPILWTYHRDFGDRLIVLGNKNTILLDVATGKILGNYEIKYNKKNENPTGEIDKFAVALFGKKEATAINLQDGRILWHVDEQLASGEQLNMLTYQGKHYMLLGLRKDLQMFDLDEGKQLWATGEDFLIWPEDIYVADDGLLVVLGLKNHQPAFQGNYELGPYGTHYLAYGMDLLTGEIKYTTKLAYFTTMGVFYDIPLLGLSLKQSTVVSDVYWDCPYGVLVYTYGVVARKIEEKTGKKVKWEQPGGEGFILIDPKTGEVKWRTNDWLLWENWDKPITHANYSKDVASWDTSISKWKTPQPIFDGWDYVYQNANNRLIKLDLRTGETLWESPEWGILTNMELDRGKIFGDIGIADWFPTHNATEEKSSDNYCCTPETGYFVLDAETGKEIWVDAAQKKHVPFNIMQQIYFPDTGKLLGHDGVTLRMLDLNNGGFLWEKKLKKLCGKINAEEAIPYILEKERRTYAGDSGGFSWYSITKTYAPATMELGIRMTPDNNILVLGPDGLFKIDQSGNILWEADWKWERNKINFKPTLTNVGLLYQYKKIMTYISLADGKVLWTSKEGSAKDTDVLFNESKDRIFLWGKKGLESFKL